MYVDHPGDAWRQVSLSFGWHPYKFEEKKTKSLFEWVWHNNILLKNYLIYAWYFITGWTVIFVAYIRTVSNIVTSFGIRYAWLGMKIGHITKWRLISCTIKLIARTTTNFIFTTWAILSTITSFAWIDACCVLVKIRDAWIYYWACNTTKRTNYLKRND